MRTRTLAGSGAPSPTWASAGAPRRITNAITKAAMIFDKRFLGRLFGSERLE
jgi:hypothetical protein